MQIGNIKKLFTEDRAVSPVIGVILMVAITVILAAVIGTFVLGLGDDLQDSSPTASFSSDFDSDGTGVITHTGGDSISAPETVSIGGGAEVDGDGESWTDGDPWVSEDTDRVTDSISAGSSVDIKAESGDPNWAGETVSVNWESANGDSSATLGSWTAPGGD